MRAQAEAVERWLWSKWVDERYPMKETARPELTELGKHYAGQFDRIIYFERRVGHDIPGLPDPLCFGAVVALRGGGAFPGSRVCACGEKPWEHALIEAWRHLNIFKNLRERSDIYPILAGRLKYFGMNQAAALSALYRPEQKNWPRPALDFVAELRRPHYDGYSLFRAVCKDYLPWHLGSERRFVF